MILPDKKSHTASNYILKINDLTWDGRGVGRTQEGKVVMLPGTIPGDEIALAVHPSSSEKSILTKNYKILSPSPQRIQHQCPHYAEGCPGSLLGAFNYNAALNWKRKHLQETLRRIGGLEKPDIYEMIPSMKKWGYRNRLELHVVPKDGIFSLGYYNHGKYISVKDCLLGNEVVRKGLKALIVSLKTGEKSSNFPKKSHIRVLLHDNGNKETVGIIFIKEERSKIVNFLSEILSNADFAGWQIKKFHNVASRFDDSIIVAANGEQQVYHRILNEDIITTEPTVFSQVNPETSVILRTKVMEVLPESGEILDLYGGYGAFALQYALQKKGKSTVVESSLEAVEAGKKFAKERKLAVEFIKADLDRFDLKALEMKRYDATILDPPRKGTHPKVMKVLNEFGAPTIVYISCHPAALARDLRMLTLYKAKCFIPLDLFPNTPDLETIALLERRK